MCVCINWPHGIVYQRWVVVRVFRFVRFRDVIHVAITFHHVYAFHDVYIYISRACVHSGLLGLSTNIVLVCFVLSGFGMLFMLRFRSITYMRFIMCVYIYMRFSMCVCIIEPYGVVYQRWVIDVVLY